MTAAAREVEEETGWRPRKTEFVMSCQPLIGNADYPQDCAAWTDPACWVLRLMTSGGHTTHEAERQASRLPAFQAADPAHIDLFAAANVRLWDEIAQASTSDWTAKMAQAAEAWAVYRQAR